MSKTTLLYKDVAPGADADAAVAAVTAQPFTDPSLLPFCAEVPPAATCELNQWGLDGAFVLAQDHTPAFWSTAMSDGSGVFPPGGEPQLTITFDKQYSSLGISFRFDAATGGYCRKVHLSWYQGATLKADADFFPDKVDYFCSLKVQSYDKLVITFLETDLPFRYAKVDWIIFGIHRRFGMDELRSASAVNETNLLASELPISKLSWTLDSREDIDYMFQLKQPVEVRNDDTLIGVYYVDSHRRASRHVYPIVCCDAIGVLNGIPFSGGVYSGQSAKALITALAAPFEVEFDAGIQDMSLTGLIKAGTRRTAIKQVLFAWGVCASTDGRGSIRIFSPSTDPVEIPQGRTFLGATVDTDSIVTEVQVITHTFAQAANGAIEIDGVKYSDTKAVYTVTNPNITATDKQNVVKISDATLVSPAIGQATAQRVYDYYQRRNTNKARIVFGGERLGDRLTVPNSWGGTNTGNLSKMEIKLSNTVVYSGETIGL